MKEPRGILVSSHADPRFNLALEELLFSTMPSGARRLFVYRNGPCVVCGRFQNPWLEADADWLAESGIPTLRRASGGGAVWHDEGNWNFSFMRGRDGFDRLADLEMLASWLSNAGFSPSVGGRGELLLGGGKVSGDAMVMKADKALHHCSLLVDADLARLRRALASPDIGPWRAETRAVRSVPSPVTRLADVRPGLDPAALFDSVLESAEASFSAVRAATGALDWADSADFAAAFARHGSRDWIYGRTPDFSLAPTGSRPASDGLLEIRRGRFAYGGLAGRLGLEGREFAGFAALNRSS